MIRYAIIAVATAALGATIALAGPGKTDPGLASFQRFNGGPPVGPFAKDEEKPRPRPSEIEKKATETVAALKAQEEAKLLRRIAVCDRLKQIALETGDSRLEDEAIRLEQKAEEVYRQRTKSLSVKTAAPARETPK